MSQKQKEFNSISIWLQFKEQQLSHYENISQCVYLLEKEETNVHHMCSLHSVLLSRLHPGVYFIAMKWARGAACFQEGVDGENQNTCPDNGTHCSEKRQRALMAGVISFSNRTSRAHIAAFVSSACARAVWCSHVSSILRRKDVLPETICRELLSCITQAICWRVMIENIQ